MVKTFQITISGQVQGVGFRPFVYGLAKKFQLGGSVCNNENGVLIYLNASEEMAHEFLIELIENAPSISVIQSHFIFRIPFREFEGFQIVTSKIKLRVNSPLTPDFAICESCRLEIKDYNNRRYGYAFTTCTNCGPRYAVTSKFPFERENTTIAAFMMCATCQQEYTNPKDRRFHSQTNTCTDCGIQLKLEDNNGKPVEGDQQELIRKASDLIRNQNILALKSTHGYLLCCTAKSKIAIKRLRDRKQRPSKPFALLYPTLDRIKKDFYLSSAEEKMLTSAVAPIVILNPKKFNAYPEPEYIAPQLDQLGVMLPSSALLTLLMNELDMPIIATSGNIHGSPILSKKSDAIQKLSEVADYFIHHNLEITFPQDDSVVRFVGTHQITLRRARGLAPNYLQSSFSNNEKILAMGAHLKSTFTYVPNSQTYVSPYFGNLDNYEVSESFQNSLDQFKELFQAAPELILIDGHFNYQSSILGKELAKKWKARCISIPHHKAHFASVLGEHGLFTSKEKILGVVWDGTGLGEDRMIWGGEFFTYQKYKMNRLAHFEYYDWLASDKMAREPRLALFSLLPNKQKKIARKKFSEMEWKVYSKLLENNTLQTSSVGRLFDAVASLLGIIDITTYEGEAAMLLENQAKKYEGTEFINFLEGVAFHNIPTKTIIANVFKAIMDTVSIPQIANSFIHTLALSIFSIAERYDLKHIACSGGVFQNAVLVEKLIKFADNSKISLKFNRNLASNDENISFGQLFYYQYIKI